MAKINLLDVFADAKTLKETAIANAKIQLEETFTPAIQRLVSDKINEEDEEDVDIDFEGGGDEPEMGFDSFDSGEEDAEPAEEGNDEDLELEALMSELDGEEGDEYMEEGDEYEDEDMMEGEEEDWQDPNPEAISEGDYDEDELEEALQAVLEMDGLGDDLDMGPNKEDGAAYTENPPNGPQFLEGRKLRTEVKRLQTENKKLKRNLNEILRSSAKLKKTINEVNLLNAKLMFFTKAQRKFNLNKIQEQKILNSFDRANTVREVKLVYTTVCESLNRQSNKRINEGYASKPSNQVRPKSIVQENFVERMQRLANIKKFED